MFWQRQRKVDTSRHDLPTVTDLIRYASPMLSFIALPHHMPPFIIRAALMGASVVFAPLVDGRDRHRRPFTRAFIVSRLGAASQSIVPWR